jgi:Tetracyclin repressor-like, C-terminal domain
LSDLTTPGPDAVAAVIARSLVARPFFCDLLAQAPLNLERNVSLDYAYAFKTVVLGEVAAVATTLRRLLGISERAATDAISTATSMAGALWQMAAPGTGLRSLYETRSELGARGRRRRTPADSHLDRTPHRNVRTDDLRATTYRGFRLPAYGHPART